MNQIEMGTYWLPRQSSTLAPQYDEAWNIVSISCIVLFIIVIGAMSWFIVRYRRKTDHDVVSGIDHNFTLEVIWTSLPSALLLWLFYIGFQGFLNATVSPGDAFEIHAVGQKWSWAFTYPNGATTVNELRIPKDRNIKVVISAKDVLHSFFIPEFRVKRDAVPGAYTTVWFNATRTGETMVECTQYCGQGHSDMLAQVHMMEQADFDKWLDEVGNEGKGLTPVAYGEKLYHSKTCDTCHTVDGTIKIGPSFKGVYGRQEHLADGSTVAVDENYIRESILVPAAKVVQGFQPVMPPFQGMLKDDQIDAIIAFLKAQK